MTEVGKASSNQAIAYTFVSSHVFYPLVISRIGGSDELSTVDLIAMTPEDVTIAINGAITQAVPTGKPSIQPHLAEYVCGESVVFTLDEVRESDPALDVFDKGTEKVRVRNFKFIKPLNSYAKDFTAVADSK